MTEQTTIRAGISLFRDWGPLWSCVALYILYQIFEKIRIYRRRSQYNEADRRRDKEIEKLRTARGEILQELSEIKIAHEKEISKTKEGISALKLSYEKRISDVRVELEKRTTYAWMEEKVIPKIDKLTEAVHTFQVFADILIKRCKVLGNDD